MDDIVKARFAEQGLKVREFVIVYVRPSHPFDGRAQVSRARKRVGEHEMEIQRKAL